MLRSALPHSHRTQTSVKSPLVPRSSMNNWRCCLTQSEGPLCAKAYQSMSPMWPARQARTNRTGTTGRRFLSRSMNFPLVSADDDPTAPSTGITGFQFPEWFVTQDQEGQTAGGRSRLLVHRKALTRGKFIDRDKKRRPVVPVRFVRACRAGHIGDIDWYAFAHNGPSDCVKQQRQLFMDERGTSGDLTEVWVRCECGKAERSMAQAALLQNRALGLCDGARPWLGPFIKETTTVRL